MNKLWFNIIKIIICILFLSAYKVSAQKIFIKTEHYPPYNINLSIGSQNSPQNIGGVSTEIIRELMQRSGYQYDIELLPWKRAYGAALEQPMHAVYSTGRIESREKLFKWVGPIIPINFVLLSKRDIKLNSFAEAKQYSIGAYGGDVTVGMLNKADIEPEIVSRDYLNPLKLARGRIDLWATGDLSGPYLAKQHGVTGLKQAFVMSKTDLYLALHKETPDAIVNHLSSILMEMKQDGTLQRISDAYR